MSTEAADRAVRRLASMFAGTFEVAEMLRSDPRGFGGPSELLRLAGCLMPIGDRLGEALALAAEHSSVTAEQALVESGFTADRLEGLLGAAYEVVSRVGPEAGAERESLTEWIGDDGLDLLGLLREAEAGPERGRR